MRFLEDGQFAKIYKGHLISATSSFSLSSSSSSNYGGQQSTYDHGAKKKIVSIKVPRVPEPIRKDKSMYKRINYNKRFKDINVILAHISCHFSLSILHL